MTTLPVVVSCQPHRKSRVHGAAGRHVMTHVHADPDPATQWGRPTGASTSSATHSRLLWQGYKEDWRNSSLRLTLTSPRETISHSHSTVEWKFNEENVSRMLVEWSSGGLGQHMPFISSILSHHCQCFGLGLVLLIVSHQNLFCHDHFLLTSKVWMLWSFGEI